MWYKKQHKRIIKDTAQQIKEFNENFLINYQEFTFNNNKKYNMRKRITKKDFITALKKYDTVDKVAKALWISKVAVYNRKRRLNIRNYINIVSDDDIKVKIWQFIVEDWEMIDKWRQEQYSRIKRIFKGEQVADVFDIDEAYEVWMSTRHLNKFIDYINNNK